VGGVVEDPATGAAAVALGGYLREAKINHAPMEIDILQGEKMGRPSQLKLSIPISGGIIVSGSAVDLQESIIPSTTPHE
jgi:PhzF family phenazine biosynthesis protein